MTAPNIGASNRFIPEGTTMFYYVATLAAYTSPTRAELNAGTNLTPEIAAAGDWAITSNAVNAPDLVSLFTPQIPGDITMGTTTIDMYSDVAGADVRALLPRNTSGYIVKFPGGDITGRKMTVFPVKVGSIPEATALNTPVTISITFYVTKIPAENIAVP